MSERLEVSGPAARQSGSTAPGRPPTQTSNRAPIDIQRRAGNRATAHLVTEAQRASLPTQAGNGAVSGLLAGLAGQATVQKEGESSGESAVAKALRTKEPGDVKAIAKKEIAGLPVDKRMELVRILAYQGWVGPFDESKIEEIWGTLTTEELVRTGSLEIVLFNHCMEVGAELDRLPNVKLMTGDFVSDTRSIALGYLKQNGDLVRAEMGGLGIPAKEGEAAAPIAADQAQKLAETQRAAASVADLQAQMEAAQKVPVGYGPASYVPSTGGSAGDIGTGGGTTSPSGEGSAGGTATPGQRTFADIATFVPGTPPPFADPESAKAAGFTLLAPPVETKDFAALDSMFSRATDAAARLLGHYPALTALTKTGSSGEVGSFSAEKDPAAARARLGGAMRAVLDNIAKAESGLGVPGGAINPLDMQPIHRQMFQGQATATKGKAGYDWTRSLPKLMAEKEIGDHEFGKVLTHMGLQGLTAAAFMLAPFTGGASLAALLAVGVGAAAANVVISNQEYDRLLTMSKSTVKPGTELVDKGQVDAARAQLEADAVELAMAVFTAATLGAGRVGKYKDLAQALEKGADAVGLAETIMELTNMLQADVAMSASMFEISLPAPAGGAPVQRQSTRPVWEDFEIHTAGELQGGRVPGIPQMDVVIPGIHNTSGNGMDRIGLRRTRSGKIEVWHFEVKWNYLETSNPDPKLWERGGRIQFDKDWEEKAIKRLCESDHPSAVASRDAVRAYIANTSGRRVGNVPMTEVLDVLRTKAGGRAVLIREGFVPQGLLEQLARFLRRGRSIRLGRVRLP